MSDSTESAATEVAPEATAPAEPTTEPAVEPKESATESIDWRAEARKWEQRSKGNKSELDTLAEKLAALEAQNGELSTKVSTYESERAHAALVAEVAEDAGVPVAALRGSTKEELTAHADTLKALLKPSAPVIPGQAKTPGTRSGDPNREAVRTLFGNN